VQLALPTACCPVSASHCPLTACCPLPAASLTPLSLLSPKGESLALTADTRKALLEWILIIIIIIIIGESLALTADTRKALLEWNVAVARAHSAARHLLRAEVMLTRTLT
jgi:hypothetical protein